LAGIGVEAPNGDDVMTVYVIVSFAAPARSRIAAESIDRGHPFVARRPC
jgi:hypothetical protein